MAQVYQQIFDDLNLAQDYLINYQLTDQGYPAFLLNENDLYKVQVGAFQQIGNAINMEQRLRDAGYSTVIVTK